MEQHHHSYFPTPQEDDDESTYSDAYDDFLERYSVTMDPVIQLKAKRRWKEYHISAAINVHRDPDVDKLVLSIKPDDPNKWWRKVSIAPGQLGVSLFTRRIRFGFLDLQFEAHSNVHCRAALNWRLFPAWSGGKSNKLAYKYKTAVRYVPNTEFRANIQCDMGWPELSGGLGAGAAQQGVDLQTGYCHVDVPRLALVWQADADQADPSPPRVVSSAAKEVVPLAVKPVDEDGQR